VVPSGFAKRDQVSALTHIQDVAASELGYVFVDPDGYLVFHDGGHRGRATRSTTVQATFADANAGVGYLYRDITPEYSRDHVYNRVSVTAGYLGAQPVVEEDVASQLLYSPAPGVAVPRDYSRATLLAEDTDVLLVARTILAAFKDARVRFQTVTLLERDLPSGWTEGVMAREIGDRVEVRIKPPGHTALGVYEAWIEQIVEEGSPGQPISITFTLSLTAERLDIPLPGGPLKEQSGIDLVLDSGTAGQLG
jgi:hypothetical protein